MHRQGIFLFSPLPVSGLYTSLFHDSISSDLTLYGKWGPRCNSCLGESAKVLKSPLRLAKVVSRCRKKRFHLRSTL